MLLAPGNPVGADGGIGSDGNRATRLGDGGGGKSGIDRQSFSLLSSRRLMA